MPGEQIAIDIIEGWRAKAYDRIGWEKHWNDIARFALPDIEPYSAFFGGSSTGATFSSVLGTAAGGPVAAERGKAVYDQTSLWAIDRGTAGFMSLVTPQNEKWQGCQKSDPFAPPATPEEKLWFDAYRDYLFTARGNPQSGFWVAHKAAMRSLWGMGTSVIFVEEAPGLDAAIPIYYCHVPLTENYLSTNGRGVVDTNYRAFRISARNAVKKWGDRVSQRVQLMATRPREKDRMIDIIHAVFPREEAMASSSNKTGGDYRVGSLAFAWASYFVELESEHLIGEGGFESFPFIVHHWNRSNGGPYAEGPMAIALADVKSLNLLSKNALMAASQGVSPPMAYADDAPERLDLNANGRNRGWLSDSGELKAKPIITGARPDWAEAVLAGKRAQIEQSLYVKLWQNIADPGMTATEAMIRSNEKGEILGPAGNSVQVGLSFQFERETLILTRKRAFVPGSPLAPPASIGGRAIGVRFSGPIDRLQRAGEMLGMQRLIEFCAGLAQAGRAEAIERLNVDEMIDAAQEILAAPSRSLLSVEQVKQMRETRQQLQQAQTAIGLAGQGGQAATAAAQGAEATAASPAMQAGLAALAANANARPGRSAAA